jgi:hypothetical protein
MVFKTLAGGQINDAKLPFGEIAPKNNNSERDAAALKIVPLAADKQFGGAFTGNLNRARLEQKFAAQQQNQPVQNDENKEILGVTTSRPFPKEIAPDETQESVLRRTFQEYAATAGISSERAEGAEKSPAEMFVDERMELNKAENKGEYKIFNSKTHAAYSTTEWAKFQKSGGIRMFPTENDIESLKSFKSVSDSNFGQKIANEVLEAMKEGAGSTRLTRALETMRAYQNNSDFQSGLVDTLGAEKFLELHAMVKDDLTYRAVLQQTLSGATSLEPEYAEGIEHGSSVGQQIAQKASVETLSQLLDSKSYPMSKDFLVEAGKRATTPGVGWIKAETKPGQFLSWDNASDKSNRIFEAISRSPAASAELLNDADFVKNGLRMSNMTDTASGDRIRNFDRIITAGTSAEAREKNAEKVEKALITLAETIGNADSYRPQDLGRISGDVIGAPREKVVSEETANALAKVVEENPQAFFEAAQSDETENGKLDKKDVQNIFTAISQYENPKRNLEASVSSQVAKLMTESASFSNQKTEKPREIGLLLDTIVKADKSASLKNASDEDKKIEMATNLFNDVAGLIPFGDMPMQGLTKLAMASAQRRATDIAKSGTTGTYADIEKGNLENKESKLNVVISRSTLKAYEQAAYTTLNDKNSSSDAKSKAAQFIQDIKSYNEALPDNEKVLDGSGKLVDPNAPATSGGQRINMNRLAQGGINYHNDIKAEEASRRIGDIVQPTAETIQSKVKTSYIPR